MKKRKKNQVISSINIYSTPKSTGDDNINSKQNSFLIILSSRAHYKIPRSFSIIVFNLIDYFTYLYFLKFTCFPTEYFGIRSKFEIHSAYSNLSLYLFRSQNGAQIDFFPGLKVSTILCLIDVLNRKLCNALDGFRDPLGHCINIHHFLAFVGYMCCSLKLVNSPLEHAGHRNSLLFSYNYHSHLEMHEYNKIIVINIYENLINKQIFNQM
ncbi:hypothetical protein BpHYR1_041449 [Brachionus plicatilis]|uniref:Uncharacterized protein n=1 Tax=Brachionus plicatilis TaxID=10195 RepID=A0A3M7SWZ6_BRAPC|nr:hypothetical protein BpHYR1_041449 [Brachionus plicatilis]